MPFPRTSIIVSYGLVYLVWGSTYFFIKAAVGTVPAPLVLALRFITGGILLLAFSAIRGGLKTLPSLRQLLGACMTGTFLLLLGNGLITVAEKSIPSYVASILAACMPFLVAFFNYALFKKGVSIVRLAGVAVGVGGIALLLWDGDSLAGGLGGGVLIAAGGVIAWAFGTSTGAAIPKPADPALSTGIQMLWSGFAALGIGLAFDPAMLTSLATASTDSLLSIAYLALMGSVALVAYNHLLAKEPSFRLSSYALVNPVIAVFLGLATGEEATPFLFFGLPLALVGLALMLYGDALRQRLFPAKAGPRDRADG